MENKTEHIRKKKANMPIDDIINEMADKDESTDANSALVPGQMTTENIRFLTLNFFLRPPLIWSNEGDYKDARVDYFITHYLSKYDVICFQEVFCIMNSRKQYLIRAAKAAGFHYYAENESPTQILGVESLCGGLLILSRYPIADTEFLPFKVPGVLADSSCVKGCLYAKIDIGTPINDGKPSQQYLHLFTSHMQASYFYCSLELYVESYVCRFKQIREARDFIKSKIGNAENFSRARDLTIFAGDFNQNGAPKNNNQIMYLCQIEQEKRYEPVLELFRDEYASLLKGLSF